MPDETTHLRLPYMLAGQAQKHVTHNEALRLLDALVQITVLDRNLTAPPGSPAEGARYIVASGGSGAWSGWDLNIAYRVDGAWMKLVPGEGWLVWVADEDKLLVWSGAAWAEVSGGGGGGDGAFSTVAVGGATADATNKLAVASSASLFTHVGAGHRIVVNKNAPGATASVLFQTGWSGRAEFGTMGSDSFGLKVSADGASWVDALVLTPTLTTVNVPLVIASAGILTTIMSGGSVPSSGGYLRTAAATQTTIGHTTSGAGTALIDINPQPSDGSSPAQFRFFRSTSTTGAASFTIHLGDGTGGVNARLAGSGQDSFVCSNNGNFGIGTSSPTAKCHVNGSLSKVSGSFDIRHPDPAMRETHRLRHCFVESPTAGDNIYRYRIEAAEDGETVTLALPGYWRHLNENPQVWVSPRRHFGRAWGEVDDDRTTLSVVCETAGVYEVRLRGSRGAASGIHRMTVEKRLPDPDRVATAVALAQAEFEAASLHRQLRFERWVSITAVLAAAFLGILACPGS